MEAELIPDQTQATGMRVGAVSDILVDGRVTKADALKYMCLERWELLDDVLLAGKSGEFY